MAAGDAQPLLLAAGKRGAALAEPVLHLVPQAGAAQGLLDDTVHVGLAGGQSVDARAVGDVLVDRFRKRVGLLEHHPDTGAQLHHVHRRA